MIRRMRIRFRQPWTGSETLFFGESSSEPGRSSDLDPTNSSSRTTRSRNWLVLELSKAARS